jgi:hypothetical protein
MSASDMPLRRQMRSAISRANGSMFEVMHRPQRPGSGRGNLILRGTLPTSRQR